MDYYFKTTKKEEGFLMPQTGVLATKEGRLLNGNEGAALHANDVGMNKWGGGKMDYYLKNTKEGCKLYFDPDKWGGGQNGLLIQKYQKRL